MVRNEGVSNQQDIVDMLKAGVPSLNTEQLINGADSGIFETLKDAGFEQGDFLPLYTFNPNAAFVQSFTATTYSDNNNLSAADVQWDKLFPAGVTSHVVALARIGIVGTDETVSLRVRNETDVETIGEITGITSVGIQVIDVDYEPTTKSSRIRIKWEWKEDTGSNTSRLDNPFICLGVKV